MINISLYAKVARLQAIILSIAPIVCLYLYTKYKYQDLNLKAFLFVASSIILFHLSANTISEYRDFKKGIDDPASKWPKYRIVSGIIDPNHILWIGIISFFLAAILGVIALLFSSKFLLIPGLFGAAFALFYSEWPLGLKYNGLGEIGLIIIYSFVIGFACIFALVNSFDLKDMLFSIPFGPLSAAVLLANNMRDYEFDIKKAKTISTIFGLKMSCIILFILVHFSFFSVLILIYIQVIPKTGFLSLLAYPIIFLSIKKIGQPRFVDVFGILQPTYCSLMSLSLLF